MEFPKLYNFLKARRQKKGICGQYNFVALRGGTFQIPKEDSETFLDLYIAALPSFSAKQFTSLAWRPPLGKFRPLGVDFDIVLSEHYAFPDTDFEELAEWLCELVCMKTGMSEGTVALTRRPAVYKATKGGDIIWKTGFHAFFFAFLVPAS